MIKTHNPNGFTLIEMVIAIALIGILAAISFPYFKDWQQNARYREAARNIASMLRDARARTIAQNIEHRLEFSIAGNSYQMARGTRAFNSTDWSDVVQGPISLDGKGISLRSGTNCDSGSNTEISFNPNGTSGTGYVCIMDLSSPPVRKFRVGVGDPTTARVAIEK